MEWKARQKNFHYSFFHSQPNANKREKCKFSHDFFVGHQHTLPNKIFRPACKSDSRGVRVAVFLILVAEFAVEWPWLAGQKSHTWYSGSLWPKSEFYPWPPANWAMGHCHVTCLWTHDMRHWRKRKYLLVSRYYWKQFMPNEYKTMNFITGKQNWYLSEKKKKVLHIYEPRSKGANALSIPIQTSMTNLLGLI